MKKDRKEMGTRIRAFRQAHPTHNTQIAFASLLGIDQQRLSGYENGTRIPHTVIARLIELGADPRWLLLGEGSMKNDAPGEDTIRSASLSVYNKEAELTTITASDFVALPLYTDEVAAGSPREMRDHEIEGPAIMPRSWCPHPEATDCVRVAQTGDSMEPTIPAGSIVSIDRTYTTPEALINKVVALHLTEDGGVTLKRLTRDHRGGYIGMPDNPSERNQPIPLAEDDRIIGLVTSVHARLT